eukprot:COSAG01_NODE_3487_length_6017_cov_6.010814_1_plen_72_part_10
MALLAAGPCLHGTPTPGGRKATRPHSERAGPMLGWAVGACALLGLLGFGVACARVGHVRACIDLVISLVLLA